jgi:DNA polymerase-3 subunit chi
MDQVLCSLTNKAWDRGHRVFIHSSNSEHSQQLDDWLWTYKDISFMPHGQLAQTDPMKTPVLIGHEDPPSELHDIMINMTNTVPFFFGRFDRLIEIVSQVPEQRDRARERYRFYQERGYTLNTHQLDA